MDAGIEPHPQFEEPMLEKLTQPLSQSAPSQQPSNHSAEENLPQSSSTTKISNTTAQSSSQLDPENERESKPPEEELGPGAGSSLLFHPSLSGLVRFLTPILLLGNIILYGFSMYYPGTRFGINIIINGIKS